MALIHVPRPENAWDPNRPVNALLKAQIVHLHDAELKLPVRQQTDIYINAIKTEGEAADYVRQVTEAIHAAHQAAAAKRARPAVTNTKKGKAKKKATPNARRKT
jgi:hypothetical protein